MDECSPKCKAITMLVVGLLIILTRMYTNLDIWVVIGALIAIKAVMIYFMPVCKCVVPVKAAPKAQPAKKKRR